MDKITQFFHDIIEKWRVSLKTVLVIDDEDYISEILSLMFSELGYSVKSVCSARDALDIIRDKDFWMILCDFKMPGMDGLEFFELLSVIRPDLKDRFVLLTGTILDERTKRLIEKKGLKTLMKPFNFSDIERLVRCFEHGGL